MADNIPKDNDMVTGINFIYQDYVENDSVVAEMVKGSTENVPCVVTRAFTYRVFCKNISHGVNFDVTGNNDFFKDSITDDY